MINYDNLRKVVAKALKEYLGCPVIRSNQNATPPSFPYVSYTITTPSSENRGTYGEYDDGIARKGVNVVWSITVISDDSNESLTLANKAKEYLDFVGTTFLNDNGVIVQGVTSVANRDNFITTEYQYKNGFDCFFWCYDEVEIPNVEAIETVQLGNTIIEPTDYEQVIAQLNAQLNEANEDLNNIKLAIEKEGVEVPDGTDPSEYPSLIAQIMPKTFLLCDEEGNEVIATTVDKETILTATANDIREGAVAATDSGITTGTKVIPSYHTTEGYQFVTSGSEFKITQLEKSDKFDFTKLQVLICPYVGSINGSVATEKVVINENVYAVNSAEVIATVTKDSENKTVNLGIKNESDSLYLLRYFTYKEIY